MMHESYMRRCFELARRAGKSVKLNPQVGAVIVHQNRIIGEGYHKRYGGPHAEVEALQSVAAEDKSLISNATMYVSLEPCNHQGKTPPCTSAIIQNQISKVVVGSLDPNHLMSGKSIKILEENGVEVLTGVLNDEGLELIRVYRTNAYNRPYVILKYAQSLDGFLGKKGVQTWLSNEYSKVLVHKWRSKVDGILIGVNTANIDNPKLTTRLYPGESPIPIVLDPNGKLNSNLELLKDDQPTLIFTTLKKTGDSRYISLNEEEFNIETILSHLYSRGIYRLMIEGGKFTLDSFNSSGIWDEARIITSQKTIHTGIKAPTLVGHSVSTQTLGSDVVNIIMNPKFL